MYVAIAAESITYHTQVRKDSNTVGCNCSIAEAIQSSNSSYTSTEFISANRLRNDLSFTT